MAYLALSENFRSFFGNLNPPATFETVASREYNTIKSLLEDSRGLAAALSPQCFLQGSYKQETAIYSIGDVDIVALCSLWQPGSGTGAGWNRDQIFDTVAAPLLNDGRYKGKVRYHRGSMCIKVGLGIDVEILPAVFKAGNEEPSAEPFRLYRPQSGSWEDGFARHHQAHLTWKNHPSVTAGNFIPLIKVFKHLRSKNNLKAVSFHIECLLYALPEKFFAGGPADYIGAVLKHVASYTAVAWFSQSGLRTPCQDRAVFTESEWGWDSWRAFHESVVAWSRIATLAGEAFDRDTAISLWQSLLGNDMFTHGGR